jgi:hypothetical protein
LQSGVTVAFCGAEIAALLLKEAAHHVTATSGEHGEQQRIRGELKDTLRVCLQRCREEGIYRMIFRRSSQERFIVAVREAAHNFD